MVACPLAVAAVLSCKGSSLTGGLLLILLFGLSLTVSGLSGRVIQLVLC